MSTTPTVINVPTPGKQQSFRCHHMGTHYIVVNTSKRVDQKLLAATLRHFAGMTVPADFYVRTQRHPCSFAEWVVQMSPTLNSEPLTAIDACHVAGILCHVNGVGSLKVGAHQKVYLRFR